MGIIWSDYLKVILSKVQKLILLCVVCDLWRCDGRRGVGGRRDESTPN